MASVVEKCLYYLACEQALPFGLAQIGELARRLVLFKLVAGYTKGVMIKWRSIEKIVR